MLLVRFISLLGGEMLSFMIGMQTYHQHHHKLGEQTDVPESSDWYNAGYIIMWGSNVPLTRNTGRSL